MTRIEWYRYLRSGWFPMEARLAWTQALIYEGKSVEDMYAWPVIDRGSQVGFTRMAIESITPLVIENYASGEWIPARKQKSFFQFLVGRK